MFPSTHTVVPVLTHNTYSEVLVRSRYCLVVNKYTVALVLDAFRCSSCDVLALMPLCGFGWSGCSYGPVFHMCFVLVKAFLADFSFFTTILFLCVRGLQAEQGRRIYLMVWNMLRPCGRISFRWKSYWFRCCRALRREENGNSRVSDFCKACQQEQHSKYRFSVLQWSAGRFVKQITCSVCMALRLGTYLENCICHVLQ